MDTPEELGSPKHVWKSCCFYIDKRCVTFSIQAFIGISLLTFCSFRLATEPDCDRAAPYWGLIGTLCGFFFRKMPVADSSLISNQKRRNGTTTVHRRADDVNDTELELIL